MRFDRDTLREITDSLTRNKGRSFLTGFGVFWGIFMLLALIGGGNGLRDMLMKNFDGFATNFGVLFADQTGKPYQGYRKDRSWTMKYSDVERLRTCIPELKVVSPQVARWGQTAVCGIHSVSCVVQGQEVNYDQIETPLIYYGRSLNEMDTRLKRKVCVIGKKIYQTLFPEGGDPCGSFIRIDGVYYQVVGVNYRNGNVNINGSAEEKVCMPISVVSTMYNYGDKVHLMLCVAHDGVSMKSLEPKMRAVVARAHHIDPTDTRGVAFMNAELMFRLMTNMFDGITILLWIVGIGTILAGAIGVSNIMMVTVRERTTEIGIRRAIGATPKMILSQIISESILLTLVSGWAGILFAVLVLNAADSLAVVDGIQTAHFQVTFWTAVISALMLTILGVFAGLAPASRAMQIKPVDAMRDE